MTRNYNWKNLKLILLSIIIIFVNCDKRQSNKNDFTQEKIQGQTEEIITSKTIDEDTFKIFNFENSFVDRDTKEVQYHRFFDYWSSSISEVGFDKYRFAISEIAKNQENCTNGKAKIVFEMKLRMEENSPVYEIMDEIEVINNYPKITNQKVYLKLGTDLNEELYIASHEDRKEITPNIHALWKINLETQKFEKINIPKGFSFENPEYYGDEL
jgi:hypothetical protein